MPIASGNSVGIDILGNADSAIAESNRVIKEMDKMKAATKAKSAEVEAAAKREQAAIQKTSEKYRGSLVPGLEKAMGATSNFLSANAALITGVVAIGVAAGKSYKEFQSYAGAVRDLAAVSGTGAEESSRLLQVLDDFEISAGDVTAATKAMTKAGLTPTVEVLAQLSDQYLAINDPMERNEFILKNLGKSGLQWVNALNQGGDALRAMSNDVNANLILTDEQIEKAEKARLAMDALADSWQGVKVAVGSGIGELIVANTELKDNAKAYEELTGVQVTNLRTNVKLRENFEAFTAQMERGALMTEFYKDKFPPLTEEMESAADAQANLEASSSQYMSVLSQVSSETETFNEKNQELLDKLAELTAEQANTAEWSNKYEDLNKEIATTQSEITALAAEHDAASQKIIFGLISQQAAATGYRDISVQALAKIGEQMGVLAKGSADATATTIMQAEAWTEALGGSSQKLVDIIGKYKALKKLSETGIVITAEIAFTTTGGAMGGLGNQGNSASAGECFTGDTLVALGDGSHRPIRDIQIGDAVLSYNTDTKQQLVTIVTETIEHVEHNPGRLLLINNHLRVTEEHALWNGSEWKHARFYNIGDLLMSIDGSFVTVTSIAELPKDEPTYNLHVDHEVHNYFAGGVLVHNAQKWKGGMVGSFAKGGAAGPGWAVVGEKQGGEFIPGVSELIYGNARVFNSRDSEKMLKTGMFGKIKGLAFGGDTDGYTNPVPIPPVYTPPAPRPGGRAGSSGVMLSGGGSGGGADGSQSPQVQQTIQMQQAAIQQAQQAQQEQKNLMLELISSVKDLPSPIGKEVAYQVAMGS